MQALTWTPLVIRSQRAALSVGMMYLKLMGRQDFSKRDAEKEARGRKPAVYVSAEEKLKRAEARIKLLEAENNFLKKLDALERDAMERKR
ncbi:hypothetical protein [Tumebacillus sp. BK434]|uniref:hypothetical protein n=1 Tax=Tumebacillus sp. BK434 TaxID=2512169 RepID=UPI001050DDC7|nr:hypothetical protein [Tumebacillus sp. BK434]